MTQRSVRVGAVLATAFLAALSGPIESAAEGLRKVIAVSRFENRTNTEGQIALNDAMADQLIDALMRSGQFTVLERQTVDDVLGEQDFANSGRVRKAQTAQTGKVVAAQVLVKGTITEYTSDVAKSGEGWNVGAFALQKNKSQAHVGLMIRLIDTTSGEVLDSQRVEGKVSSGGMGFQVGLYQKTNAAKTPMAKATQQAIDEAVGLIAEKLKNVPFETRVIRQKDAELVIAAGSNVGTEVGDEFDVFTLGEEFVDPMTGESLGRDEDKVGTVKITEVRERYSKAQPTGQLGSVKPGDVVRER